MNNRTFGISLAAVVVGMVGVVLRRHAAVPRVLRASPAMAARRRSARRSRPAQPARSITVRFNANTNPNLPWDFRPAQAEIRLPLGEDHLAFYTARNLASTPVTGVALYNVTPDTAGKYFHKTACFCFNQQTLAAGQQMQFPLSFWVDPAIAKDPNTADIRTITLSYTFFRTLEDAEKSGALAQAGPHVGPPTRADPLNARCDFAMMRQPFRGRSSAILEWVHEQRRARHRRTALRSREFGPASSRITWSIRAPGRSSAQSAACAPCSASSSPRISAATSC